MVSVGNQISLPILYAMQQAETTDKCNDLSTKDDTTSNNDEHPPNDTTSRESGDTLEGMNGGAMVEREQNPLSNGTQKRDDHLPVKAASEAIHIIADLNTEKSTNNSMHEAEELSTNQKHTDDYSKTTCDKTGEPGSHDISMLKSDNEFHDAVMTTHPNLEASVEHSTVGETSNPSSASKQKKSSIPRATLKGTTRPIAANMGDVNKSPLPLDSATGGSTSLRANGRVNESTDKSTSRIASKKGATTPRNRTHSEASATHRTSLPASSSSSASNTSATPSTRRSIEVKSKVGSLANANHKPRGGSVKIQSEKLDFSHVKSKCGSTENAKHKAGGGNVKIVDTKLAFKESGQAKVGSLQQASHKPSGGNVKIRDEKLKWEAKSKIGSLDNAKERPDNTEKSKPGVDTRDHDDELVCGACVHDKGDTEK